MKKWTKLEEEQLTRFWQTHKALGWNDTKICNALVMILARSFASVMAKADYLNLTTRSSQVAHEQMLSSQGH